MKLRIQMIIRMKLYMFTELTDHHVVHGIAHIKNADVLVPIPHPQGYKHM